ncbi:PHP domain-containing protein [Polaromonas sp. P1(28)-13]|nr:PHP domain-containing protein [Polaromonas sp. P1(28)-13]
MSFNHALSVRSDFSIGESLLQIDHIIKQAKDLGYESVALVDTMSVHNIVDFSNKAKKAGLKPIIGCRLRVYDDPTYRKPAKSTGIKEAPNQMVAIKVYLTGDKGITSLMKLLTQANTKENFYYNSRCGWNDIMELEDVVVSTGDFFSLWHHPDAENILENIVVKFGLANVFNELVPINTPLFDTLNARALAASRKQGVLPLVTYPTLYGDDADAESLDVLHAITTQTKMSVGYRPVQAVRDFGFKEPKHLLARVTEAHGRVVKWNPVSGSELRDNAILWRDGVKNIETLAGMCLYEFKRCPCRCL